MTRDVAVAAVVVFSVGVMSGMMVTIMVAIGRDRGRATMAGQSLHLLERRMRRILGTDIRDSAVRTDR